VTTVGEPPTDSNPKKPLTNSVVSGTSWTYASRYGGKIINLIATAVLARLLTQEDFGVAGYALVFIGFLEILEGFGVGQALVYVGSDEKARNDAFKICVLTGIVLGVVTYLIAPLAGIIFNDTRAVEVTQALALIFPLTALRTVHRSILQRDLRFAGIAIPEFSKAGVKALAAIGFAVFAFGPWSLIFAQIISTAVETILYWRINRWRPKWFSGFDLPSVRRLLSYGSGIAGLQVLGAVLLNLDYLLIGRYMGAAALGTYMIGFRVPSLLIQQFISTTSKVIFPVFVHMNENKDSLAAGWLMAIRYIMMFTVPASLGLVAIADPFVISVFGEKWREAIPVVIVSLLQAAITVPALWYAAVSLQTIAAVAWTQVAVISVMTAIRLGVASRVLAIPFVRILEAMSRPLICGTIMLIAVFWCNHLTASIAPISRLLLGIACGLVVYGMLSWFVLRNDIQRAIEAVRDHRKKTK